MAWLITKNIIEPENKKIYYRGTQEQIDKLKKGVGVLFKLYDDDRELYAEGIMDKEDFEPLDDFGIPNWGCAYMKIKVDNKWIIL